MEPVAFTPRWLAGDPVAVALLPRAFDDPHARAVAAGIAAERAVDPAVLEALAPVHPAQEAARDALAAPGAVAVVTGQQAGLFGGPLYTLYKAAAAIVDARQLAAETGRPCVPVFWLQNEDHDYDEIASCTVLGPDGRTRTVTVPGDPADAGRSIAARRYPAAIGEAVDAIDAVIAGAPHADAVVGLLRRAYTPGTSPDRAFRALIEALFARHGLVVVDPSDPRIAAAARPVHRRAIDRAAAVSAAAQTRVDALRAAGIAVQVHVRPGAPLSFFHPDGPSGPRHRVEPRGDTAGGGDADRDGFRLVGADRVVPRDTVLAGWCSTSALLRPILQDTLLPTVAYVGGPGEIAYFAQLPPIYAAFDLAMPLVVPRARFRVVDDPARRLLDRLGLTVDRLGEPRDRLLGERGGEGPDPDAIARALVGASTELLDRFAAEADPSGAAPADLERAIAKTRATIARAAGRLAGRYRRIRASRDEVAVDRLDRLLARLRPDGQPQERVLGWPTFGARYGDAFVDAILAAVVPFDGSERELRP
ncbi:MAG: bacillithiol biosynthesis cysteine-adding enzyme BshC [Myxococcota bacterium]